MRKDARAPLVGVTSLGGLFVGVTPSGGPFLQAYPKSSPPQTRLKPLLQLLLAALCFTATSFAQSPAAHDLQRGSYLIQWGNSKQRADYIKLCRKIIASDKETPATKIRAYELHAGTLRALRKYRDSIKVAEAMIRAFPQNGEAKAKAIRSILDTHLATRKYISCARDVERYRQLAPKDTEGYFKLRNDLNYQLVRRNQFKQALAFAEATLALKPDARFAAQALWWASDAAGRLRQYTKQTEIVKRLIEPNHLQHHSKGNQQKMRRHYAHLLATLKRHDDLRAYCAVQEKIGDDRALSQELAKRIADSHFAEAEYKEAIESAERVFVAYPEITKDWWNLQYLIAQAHAKLGQHREAILAARIAMDAAEYHIVNGPASLIANSMRAIDKNEPTNANAFVRYMLHGPDGEDKKPGTADDLRDVLDRLYPRPQYAKRRAAFAKARQTAGDRATGSTYRASSYTYSGQPREALPCLAEAFRRTTLSGMPYAGRRLVIVGLRSIRNTFAGSEKQMAFVLHGPAGPDGKAGTADDPSDPFTNLLPKTSASPSGLKASEAQRIRQARKLLQQMSTDPREPAKKRPATLRALGRLNEALADSSELTDWYADLIPACGQRYEFIYAFAGYLAACRGPVLHLAGANQVWKDFDTGKVKLHPKIKRDYDQQKREWIKSFNNVARLTKRHEFSVRLFPESKK
ncbi:MAG: hypothetical protein QGG53_10245 [Planctomycetota bacterium]|jgi:hypothetical protein|nr:hypothetical protein [Planctomycetota bacterium]